MQSSHDTFAPPSDDAVRRLVAGFPLAWVCSGVGETFQATLLPLQIADTGSGPVTDLLGHFPRNHSQVAKLQSDPEAWLLFLGPNAYVSPSWLRDRRQAPTWNYASVQLRAGIEFFEDDTQLETHLRQLVASMEAGRPRAWSIDDMAERYALLSQRIVGFHARVLETRARFKLGQDERDDVYADILDGLSASGAGTLLDWMNCSNAGRH